VDQIVEDEDQGSSKEWGLMGWYCHQQKKAFNKLQAAKPLIRLLWYKFESMFLYEILIVREKLKMFVMSTLDQKSLLHKFKLAGVNRCASVHI
jgi:hypothetical protein